MLLLRTGRLTRISVDYLLDVDSMAETDGCFVVSKFLFHIRIRVAFLAVIQKTYLDYEMTRWLEKLQQETSWGFWSSSLELLARKGFGNANFAQLKVTLYHFLNFRGHF